MQVWDGTFHGDPNIVDVYVSRLRDKIDRPSRPRHPADGARRRIQAAGRCAGISLRAFTWRWRFAAGMVLVSVFVAGFVYIEVRKDLRESVQMGLEARAKTIRAKNADVIDERPGLIDADEAFAQVLTADGAVDSSTRPAVAQTPLLTPRRLCAGPPGRRSSTFHPPGLDSARVLVVPAGDGRFIVVGATLSNSQEALYRLLGAVCRRAAGCPDRLVADRLVACRPRPAPRCRA